jgi:eukaryotic-like serine/threonine-protein kinase
VTDSSAFKAWARDPSSWARAAAVFGVVPRGFLAEGGQGLVFEGKVHGRKAAIKLYFPGQVQLRIQREVDALGQLSSPSIVRLLWSGHLDTVEHGKISVVATDFVDGVSLSEHISRTGPLDDDALGELILDVARAIREFWMFRIVHRDIKPDNIMLKTEGGACVIDLGLARHLNQASLTALGASWGTLGYLSPEQCNGQRQLTCKSDIFALGVTCIEAGVGGHPTQRDQDRLLASHFERVLPTRLHGRRHEAILARMVHPRPTARPTPEQVIAAVESERRPR